MKFKPLPIGVDDFEKIREQGYYYVDKTLLIKELLEDTYTSGDALKVANTEDSFAVLNGNGSSIWKGNGSIKAELEKCPRM